MLVAVAILAMAARDIAVPQAVTSVIAPPGSSPGCYPNYDGTFVFGPVNVSTNKRDLDERNTQLGITLQNSILTDPLGRTGYIASNYQLQWDDPPQAGAIWTAGFTVCENGRLALGGEQAWYKCLSGNFYNIYFKAVGDNCILSYMIASGINGAGGPVSGSVTGSQVITAKAGTTTAGTSTESARNTAATGTSSTHTSTSSTSVKSFTSHSATSNKSNPKKSTSNSGLSSGAKIGIGVGVGVGVGCLLLALASFLLLRRRLRRRYQDGPSSVSQHSSDKPVIGEVSAKDKSHELAAGRGQLPELPVKEMPQELPTERD